MAIGFPNKSITWSPMAIAFVTGLACSTMLALLMTPANYEMLERLRRRLRSRRLRYIRKRKYHEQSSQP
jgi:HAE1 family hydrophobic/amphiphilic exporter-1